MAKVPGATTSSSSGSGDRSSTRRSTLKLTTRSLRPAPRSAGISASTIPADRTRALTGRRRIEPISPGCRRSRRLEPGRGSTYRAGKTVRTDRASSLDDATEVDGVDPDWTARLLGAVGEMSAAAFERLCQRLLRESGFTRVEVTGRAGDGGIDGIGVLRVNLVSFHVLFQAKRWKGSVGPGVVRD